MDSLKLNARAARLVDAMESDAQLLGVRVSRLANGARLLDCGIEAPGGLEAGRLLAEVCMGGAGLVSFVPVSVEDLALPGVLVRTDHPAVACLASQYAGWAVKPEGFFAMGSGPLRAIARVETALYETLGYAEAGDGPGVLVLETRSLPDAAVADWIAKRSGVAPERLSLLVAPTATPAAGVQIVARVVETALHKLHELGFDVKSVRTASGLAPLPPVAKSDTRAIGRTNDCVLYGGRVELAVDADDAVLERLVPQVPSSASRDYGTPFYELFKRYGWDFYKVDPHLFSPAQIAITSLRSGRTFEAGEPNAGVLRQSLFG